MGYQTQRGRARFWGLVLCLSLVVFMLSSGAYAGSPVKAKGNGERDAVARAGDAAEGLKWEFSTSASLNIYRVSYENESYTLTTLTVPIRLGYFIMKGLEMEPELWYQRISSEGDSMSELHGFCNLAYNFKFNSDAKTVPFLLAGVGIYSASADGESESSLAIDGGAGFKWLVSRNAALRFEYRLIYYKIGEEPYRFTVMNHLVMAGLSIFF